MTINKKTIVKPTKTSPRSKPDAGSASLPATAKPLSVASMHRVVSKKLAVGKLVMAKRLS